MSSDIPATRKVAGFVGHNATKACSRCLKTFPRVNDRLVCSGFDRSSWPPRNHDTHCRQARKGLNAKTKADKQRLECECGARYSSYAQPIPGHGKAPHEHLEGSISKRQFQQIQKKIKMMNIPLDIGRIPYKIKLGMSRPVENLDLHVCSARCAS